MRSPERGTRCQLDGATPTGDIVSRYAELENKAASVAGRVTRLHMMGKGDKKFAFVDVRDWTGKIQVQVRMDKLSPEAWAVFENAHVGDLLGFQGTVGKSKTGEITLFAERFTYLTKAIRPLPEKWHGVTDPEIRYRQRYLDLISNPDILQKFLKRTKILSRMRRFLAPQREAMTRLASINVPMFDATHRARIAEVGEDMLRAIEELDAARSRRGYARGAGEGRGAKRAEVQFAGGGLCVGRWPQEGRHRRCRAVQQR